MRQDAEDALYVLRVLTIRGYICHLRVSNALHSVAVQGRRGGPRWYDAGSLDRALLQINLDEYPQRSA